MKKLEIIIRPEKLDDLKEILNSCDAHGLMISNIMGYGLQKGHKQSYSGVDFGGKGIYAGPLRKVRDDKVIQGHRKGH